MAMFNSYVRNGSRGIQRVHERKLISMCFLFFKWFLASRLGWHHLKIFEDMAIWTDWSWGGETSLRMVLLNLPWGRVVGRCHTESVLINLLEFSYWIYIYIYVYIYIWNIDLKLVSFAGFPEVPWQHLLSRRSWISHRAWDMECKTSQDKSWQYHPNPVLQDCVWLPPLPTPSDKPLYSALSRILFILTSKSTPYNVGTI